MDKQNLKLLAKLHTDLIKKNEEDLLQELDIRNYTGKFNVNLDPDMHKRLVIEAHLKDASISSIIKNKLRNMMQIEDYLRKEEENATKMHISPVSVI